jgi:hypothetical protein
VPAFSGVFNNEILAFFSSDIKPFTAAIVSIKRHCRKLLLEFKDLASLLCNHIYFKTHVHLLCRQDCTLRTGATKLVAQYVELPHMPINFILLGR